MDALLAQIKTSETQFGVSTSVEAPRPAWVIRPVTSTSLPGVHPFGEPDAHYERAKAAGVDAFADSATAANGYANAGDSRIGAIPPGETLLGPARGCRQCRTAAETTYLLSVCAHPAAPPEEWSLSFLVPSLIAPPRSEAALPIALTPPSTLSCTLPW